MRFRVWLASKLSPAPFARLDELERIQNRVGDAYRWCSDFDQMCDLIDWVRKPSVEISQWREMMRKKYAHAGKPAGGTP